MLTVSRRYLLHRLLTQAPELESVYSLCWFSRTKYFLKVQSLAARPDADIVNAIHHHGYLHGGKRYQPCVSRLSTGLDLHQLSHGQLAFHDAACIVRWAIRSRGNSDPSNFLPPEWRSHQEEEFTSVRSAHCRDCHGSFLSLQFCIQFWSDYGFYVSWICWTTPANLLVIALGLAFKRLHSL